MNEKILILVDDSESPFWRNRPLWKEKINSELFKLIEVFGFNKNFGIDDVQMKLTENNLIFASISDYYVVTDSMFGTNDQGGADLLKYLFSKNEWKRAVIYSEDPNLGELEESSNLILVKKHGRPDMEEKNIIEFIITGKYPHINLLYEMRDSLKPLYYQCESFSELKERKHSVKEFLQPMVSYARPKGNPTENNYWFDSLLVQGNQELPNPYSASRFKSNCEHLSWIEPTFKNYFRQGKMCELRTKESNELEKDLLEKKVEEAWYFTKSILHPLDSLMQNPDSLNLPAVRLLWETIQTGGDSALLVNCPIRKERVLGAVLLSHTRKLLDNLSHQISSDPESISRLTINALEDIINLDSVLDVVKQGERDINDPDI